jgi:hypothetical protein
VSQCAKYADSDALVHGCGVLTLRIPHARAHPPNLVKSRVESRHDSRRWTSSNPLVGQSACQIQPKNQPTDDRPRRRLQRGYVEPCTRVLPDIAT